MSAITTSTIDYEDQLNFMMSYAGIRSQILQVKDESLKNTHTPIIKRNGRPKQVKRTVSTLDEFKSNPDVICAIQSEPSLLNMLVSYRKQKIPVVYLYVDHSGFLTVIIKVISYYPVVVIRLPVNDHSVYINPNTTEAYYSFPISHISFKSTGKSMQYQLVLYNSDSLKLDFNIFTGDNEKRNTTITNVNIVPREILGTLLQTESISSIGKNDIMSTDPMVTLNSSIILMVSAVPDIGSIFEFSCNKAGIDNESYITIGYDKLSPDSCRMIYSFRNTHMNENIPICSENDSILWSFYIPRGTSKRYTIETYDNLFKMNYSKYIYGKSKMYYVVVSFQKVMLFIRIIWSGDMIQKQSGSKHNLTFGSLFDKNTQIMDMYMFCENTE